MEDRRVHWDAQHIPNCLYPSDNEYGIPTLRPDLQPHGLDLPLIVWGSMGRTKVNHGTWAFYTDDMRFQGLYARPQTLLNTAPTAVIEPNFTVGPQTPMATAIYNTYRKRWLCRTWQELAHVRVWVDLFVANEFAEINMLGVPLGWRYFATRGFVDGLDTLAAHYEVAKRWASAYDDTDPMFLVYGGGRAVGKLCKEEGWLWAAEQQTVANKSRIEETLDQTALPLMDFDEFLLLTEGI